MGQSGPHGGEAARGRSVRTGPTPPVVEGATDAALIARDPGVGDATGPPGIPGRPGAATSGDGTPGVPTGSRRFRALRTFILCLPPLFVVAGVVYGLLLPSRFSAVPIFAAATLVAAPFYSFLGTAAVGVATLIGTTAHHEYRGDVARVEGLTELITCVVIAALALLTNRVVRRGQEMLASARGIAEAVQLAVLPHPADRIGGLDVAAHYEAAQADAFIGGDLYAVQDTPHGVRLIVGDVRGKGTGAVSAVAVVIGAFREAAEEETTLEAVAQRLDRALAREGVRRRGIDDFEGFTTAVLAEVPHGSGTVRLVNRGHPSPLLLHPDGRLEELAAPDPALPLGMTELGIWPDAAQEADFGTGAMLLMFTDGLTEARDKRGVFYDPVTRLDGRVFDAPGALLTVLTSEVRRHTGDHATDDMALLAVYRP